MCGIAGFLLAPSERVDTARLTRLLHEGIDPRGGDATGAAWVDSQGQTHHFTVVGRAREFRSAHPNAAHNARLAILHTRMATQGDKRNPLNNHPVRSGHFLAVHNGHIHNDAELFATLPFTRHGEVDSEAIVAVIRHAHMKGESITHALERVEGRMATAWIDDREPNILHMARGSASPLAVAMTPKGSVIFASTLTALDAAMDGLGLDSDWEALPAEGQYLRFVDGRLSDVASFTPNEGTPWWEKCGTQGHKGTHNHYARDQFESDVLGLPKKPAKKKNKPRTVQTASLDTYRNKQEAQRKASTELVPYSDDTYQLAFSSGPYGTDPDTWEWGWDAEDLAYIASHLTDKDREV